MSLEEAVRLAAERARRLRVDPQVTISEVYEAELLLRLQRKLRGGVVWKGGTVLRLEGSERFSRDLDATRKATALTGPKLQRALVEAGEGLSYLAGIEFQALPRSAAATYRFVVPGLRQPVRVSVEISLREKLLLPSTTVTTARIAHPSGIEPVVVARLDAAELLAEKVRALVMRGASRDIYDVYWLLERGSRLDAGLFRRKMDYYRKIGRKVDPAAAVERALDRLASYHPSRIKMELANLLPAAQRGLDFAVIVEDVARALRRLRETMAEGPRKRPQRRAR